MAKKDTHIPVTILPSTPRPAPAPVAPTPAPVSPKPPSKKSPAPRPPRHERTEAERRRLMWLIVILGSLIALVGMILIWPMQNKTGSHDTIFQKIVNTLTPKPKTPESAGQKEIRNLDKQVFPQFQ